MTGESILTLVSEHVAGAFLLHAAGEVDFLERERARPRDRRVLRGRRRARPRRGALPGQPGIRAIEHALRRLRSDDRSLLIVSPPDTAAQWTFRVAGFDSALLVESVDVALSSTDDPNG
jgi:hypothetical protein